MGNLFSPKVTVPAPPAPTPPPTMPDPFGPASQDAARKAQAAAIGSGGRSSTILSTAASRAAGTVAGGYGSAKLGAS